MDREIGRLRKKLEELKLFEKTQIVMVGDHGEGLGEYFIRKGVHHVGHIHYLYDIYMRVPLIICRPSEKSAGRREKMPVTLLDIGPTVMDMVGFRRMSHFTGRNLFDLKSDVQQFSVFEETYKPEAIRDKFAILKHPWHLVLTPEEKAYELFNLSQDPRERENIYQEKALLPEVIELKKKLDSLARKALAEKSEIKIDDKTKEMLRALGYIR
jgi:arylsulfatase A-like enzyme